MMNIILRFTAFICAFSIFFISCSEEDRVGPINTDVNKMVSFAQDTFYINETAGDTSVSIVLPRYVNGRVNLILGATDGSAKKDNNYKISNMKSHIVIGASGVDFPIEILDDTVMNIDRSFTLELLTVTGAAFAGTTRQKCVIIIKDNDAPPEAEAIFTESAVEVFENAEELNIHFEIRGEKSLENDATITFDYVKGVGNANFNHFEFKDKGIVHVKKGDTTGFVTLKILNNSKQNSSVWASIIMSEADGINISDEPCELTILDDDIERTVKFDVIVDTVLENAGTIDVKVTIDGRPLFDEPIIEGEIAFKQGDRGLTISGSPLFKVRGDTTVIFTIDVEDNDDFGIWGDTLYFKYISSNLVKVDGSDSLALAVSDNERKMRFETGEYTLGENAHSTGDVLTIPIVLDGGVALEDTKIKLSVVGGDALPSQYELRTPDVTIRKGSDRISATFKVLSNTNVTDVFLNLNIETDHPNTTLTDGADSVCVVTILNEDANVQFETSEDVLYFNNTVLESIMINGFNIGEEVKVKLEVTASDGVTYSGFEETPLGIGDGSFNLQFGYDFDPGVKHGSIKLKIVSVIGEDDVEIDNIINPNLVERTFYLIDADKLVEAPYINATAWEKEYVMTEEPIGQDEGRNGLAELIFDGNDATFWHSRWSDTAPPAGYPDYPKYPQGPFTLIFDMLESTFPTKVELTTRAGRLEDLVSAQIYIGDSPEESDASWKLINSLVNPTPYQLKFGDASAPAFGRYIKIVFDAKMGNDLPLDNAGNVSSCGELRLFGY